MAEPYQTTMRRLREGRRLSGKDQLIWQLHKRREPVGSAKFAYQGAAKVRFSDGHTDTVYSSTLMYTYRPAQPALKAAIARDIIRNTQGSGPGSEVEIVDGPWLAKAWRFGTVPSYPRDARGRFVKRRP